MPPWLVHTQARGGQVAIDPDDIGGTVTSAKGPEAGVWVIAETTELPTTFARIVVTDDRGRYVLPDLPTRPTPPGTSKAGRVKAVRACCPRP